MIFAQFDVVTLSHTASRTKIRLTYMLTYLNEILFNFWISQSCDGVGGTVKRRATWASLQSPYNDEIMTPHQLFAFAQSEIPSLIFHYSATEDYEQV